MSYIVTNGDAISIGDNKWRVAYKELFEGHRVAVSQVILENKVQLLPQRQEVRVILNGNTYDISYPSGNPSSLCEFTDKLKELLQQAGATTQEILALDFEEEEGRLKVRARGYDIEFQNIDADRLFRVLGLKEEFPSGLPVQEDIDQSAGQIVTYGNLLFNRPLILSLEMNLYRNGTSINDTSTGTALIFDVERPKEDLTYVTYEPRHLTYLPLLDKKADIDFRLRELSGIDELGNYTGRFWFKLQLE